MKFLSVLAGLTTLLTSSPSTDLDSAPINARYILPPNTRSQKLVVNGSTIYVWSRADSVKIVNGKPTVWTRARIDSIKPAIRAIQDTLPPFQDTLPPFQDTLPPFQDTVVVTVPKPDTTIVPAPAQKLFGVGPWHPAMALVGTTRTYSGAQRTIYPPALKALVDSAQTQGGVLLLSVSRAAMKNADGTLSIAGFRSQVAAMKMAVPTMPSVVQGIIIIDDVVATTWGGTKPSIANIDTLAYIVKQAYPTTPTMVRLAPSKFASGTMKYVNVAIAQYDGPYRDGTPEVYRDRELAAGAARGLRVMLSLNVLDGGCGPVTLGSCVIDPNTNAVISGTSRAGTFANFASVRRYQMSAAEMRYYGRVFIMVSSNIGLISWRTSKGYIRSSYFTDQQWLDVSTFDTQTSIIAAWTYLVELGRHRGGI